MRCLYCGKELALLKRWTSGGEFCSDAHRQQYQDEYNQLALNRLLQAKPPVEGALKEAETPPAVVPTFEPRVEAPAHIPVHVETQPSWTIPQASNTLVADSPSFTDEDDAPGDPVGFLVEIPVPASDSGIVVTPPELSFENTPTPSLPSGSYGEAESRLPLAGQVVLEMSGNVQESSVRRKEQKLELREFARGAPTVQMDLRAKRELELLETSEKAMDILILPQSPEASPPLWTAPEQGFTFDAELGELARAHFQDAGFGDSEESRVSLAPAVEEVTSVEPRSAGISTLAAVEPVSFNSEDPGAASLSEADVRKPQIPFEPQQPAVPVFAETEPEEIISQPAERVPQLVTKPLPLTLHGLAAGKGKAVQIFQSAVSTGVDIQVPRPNGLPLRAVMILGPAESFKAVEEKPAVSAKPDVRKPAPRPEPRFSNGKNRKPEVRVTEPERKEPEKKIAIAVEERAIPTLEMPAKPPEKKPVPPKPAEVRPAAAEESNKSKGSLPAPLSAPYNPPDLGLPSLNLQAGDSFFSRLPVVGKIGAAALVVMIVAGGLYFMTRGGGGTSANTGSRVMEAGPALRAGDSGWITDWGAEAGVKRQHEISVLRPSMNLTDYRIEFQAQIETKALGWVYRTKDPKNYYVTRIEIVKPGLEPTVALVRFAVINGEEQPHAQFPLSLAVRIDTLYKIRFEAVGDKFTTWVQDQKVDEWTDDRIKTGGVGLYNLWGERMSLKGGVNVVPLVMRSDSKK